MNTLNHPIAPEEIMAMLDEELSAAERQAVLQHLSHCAECAALRRRLESTSRSLAEWRVPEAPESLTHAIGQTAAGIAQKVIKPRRHFTPILWASGAVLAAFLGLVLFTAPMRELRISKATEDLQRSRAMLDQKSTSAPSIVSSLGPADENGTSYPNALQSPATIRSDRYTGDSMNDLITRSSGVVAPDKELAHTPASGMTSHRYAGGGGAPSTTVANEPAAPMIARHVSLTILVKDIPQARTALDRILSNHGGYPANLTISTPESGARSFQASLRIPALQVESALTALRALGQIETESQSGEEVSQQHTDLEARLQNARETELRLRALAQRAGKMDEILEVEEQISQTRGEIEQMEAEQKTLDHRVNYAEIDLQLTEQYEAHLTDRPASIRTQLRNSIVSGIRNAGVSLLALILLIEEIGPEILVWTLILAFPAWIIWRRYRRATARF